MRLSIGNKKIFVGGTHLDSKSQESRLMQYEITKNEILNPYISDSIPFYLAGDFNTSKEHEDYKKMMDDF